MPMKPVLDEFISAGDLRFHYVQWGEHGTPIVCISGITANAFCFQAFADGLADNHRVIAYDLRGRGDSEKPEHGYSVAIHADDLVKLIDAWGLERPVVLGHSLGAFIALYFAAHYPDKLSKLILVDAGADLPWKPVDERPAWLAVSMGRLEVPVPSFEEYMQRLKAAPFLGPYWNKYLDTYFEHDVIRRDDGSVVAKTYRGGAFEDLVVDNDQLLPEESAAASKSTIKDCRYVNFPTLNHYTIIFGVENGPVEEIRKFVDEG